MAGHRTSEFQIPTSRRAAMSVGRSVPRLEGQSKVTGTAQYIRHLPLPGMLHAKIHRSTLAHARILRIDAGAALALPDVHAVITIDEVLTIATSPYYGPAFHDQPILAHQKVR